MTTFSVNAAGAAGVIATTFVTPVTASPQRHGAQDEAGARSAAPRGENTSVSVDVGLSGLGAPSCTLSRRANRAAEAKPGRQPAADTGARKERSFFFWWANWS